MSLGLNIFQASVPAGGTAEDATALFPMTVPSILNFVDFYWEGSLFRTD